MSGENQSFVPETAQEEGTLVEDLSSVLNRIEHTKQQFSPEELALLKRLKDALSYIELS